MPFISAIPQPVIHRPMNANRQQFPFIGINVTATGRDAGIDSARYKAEMFFISFRITVDCIHQTRQVWRIYRSFSSFMSGSMAQNDLLHPLDVQLHWTRQRKISLQIYFNQFSSRRHVSLKIEPFISGQRGKKRNFLGSTKCNAHLPDESQTGQREAGDFRSMVRADWSFQSKTRGPSGVLHWPLYRFDE